MNTKAVIVSIVLLSVALCGGIFFFTRNVEKEVKGIAASSPKEVRREIVQYPINPNSTPDVSASKLPTFTYDISESKFSKILSSSIDGLKDLIDARIVRTADASTSLPVHFESDGKNKMLVVRPEEVANFTPGSYKLSLTLRTLEGSVNVEQDFTWGVIAVNTNKSIYTPGETVKFGIGVLDDDGNTLCMDGFDHVSSLSMTITNPIGVKTKLSIDDGTIRDSKKCGPITVTNEADFQALYKTSNSGVYQITVEAENKNGKRQITDYFKVQNEVSYDVERLSFPTRIYPRAIYPVTFRVTAKKDFNGEVSDIVPAFFSIQNMSNNGFLQKEGDFNRIIWKVNLKAGISQDFTYFIKFPPVSPEFYLIGPIKIGDFMEARQWQIASDTINSTTGLVTYENNGGSQTFSRIWTGAPGGSFPQGWNPDPPTAGSTMSNTPADSRWFREVSSPKTGEKLVAIIDNVNADDLYVFRWSGSAWAQEIKVDLTVNTADTTRMLDIAYEEESGEALFVYSKATGTSLFYRRRTPGASGSWSGELTATTLSAFARWVRLKPQLNSDSILVGILNDSERVGAMVWEGSTNSFTNILSDASGTQTATSDEQAFDVAWETNSQTPMIFWGSINNNVVMREYSGGSWQAESIITTGAFAADLDWLFASSDPSSSSNYISLGMQENAATPVCRFAVWKGTSLEMNNNTVTCTSNGTNNLIDTAFENSGGKAMFTLVVSTASAQLSWLTWTSSGFSTLTTNTGSSGVIEGVQLYSDLNTKSMLFLYHDANGDLFDREWDGSSWSAIDTALHTDLCAAADNDTEPYGFGFDRNLETQVAYRWFANSIDLGVGLSVLTNQDTPYTLTSANQAFRLRMLLYYPDSLQSSIGRQYKLQYVDPGSGTCDNPTGGTPSIYTDVPSSGGSTISFSNNGTLNDGDNISTSSADPVYLSYTTQYQDYEESNNFTNSRTNLLGDQTSIWDFSLIDNTPYDRIAQTYCFRVARSNDLVLRIGIYPQISTAALDDVLIQGGTQIDQGTAINNP